MKHTFPLRHTWHGDSSDDDYDKDMVARAAGKVDLRLSAGAGPGHTAHKWNPEDTVGAALVQCHTLTFLALAHKVGLAVTSVETSVEVALTEDRPIRIGKITLRPLITVAEGTDVDKTKEMYDKAHKYCYIANSLNAEIVMEPEVAVV